MRHYTYGGDLAHGIRLAMESDAAVNEDVNLSTAASTTVLELATAIWRKVHGPDREFRFVSDPPFEHDVQMRVPDVRKAASCWASKRPPRSTPCSMKSSPGSAER